jgi:hypothetical protein
MVLHVDAKQIKQRLNNATYCMQTALLFYRRNGKSLVELYVDAYEATPSLIAHKARAN